MANEYKCDICGKPATVHITKIIDSKKVKIHLCSECAEKASMDAINMPEQILPKIKELEEQLIRDVSKASKSGVCPTCSTSFSDVEKGSRFGCPDCYRVFDLLMSENIKKIQGSDTHKGKRPRFGHDEGREASGKSEKEKLAASIGLLDSKLKEALAEEEYEQAAAYRDQIRELKERLKENE